MVQTQSPLTFKKARRYGTGGFEALKDAQTSLRRAWELDETVCRMWRGSWGLGLGCGSLLCPSTAGRRALLRDGVSGASLPAAWRSWDAPVCACLFFTVGLFSFSFTLRGRAFGPGFMSWVSCWRWGPWVFILPLWFSHASLIDDAESFSGGKSHPQR